MSDRLQETIAFRIPATWRKEAEEIATKSDQSLSAIYRRIYGAGRDRLREDKQAGEVEHAQHHQQ